MEKDKELTEKEKDLIRTLQSLPYQIVCTYHDGKRINAVAVDIQEGEHIAVEFTKGYVVVKTENETKFVCKGKSFISLWR